MHVCTYVLRLPWKVRGIQEQLNRRSMCTSREHMDSELLQAFAATIVRRRLG